MTGNFEAARDVSTNHKMCQSRAFVIPLCDNEISVSAFPFGDLHAHRDPLESFVSLQGRRLLGWLLLLVILAYLSYASFRAYLNPEFLIGFANLFSC